MNRTALLCLWLVAAATLPLAAQDTTAPAPSPRSTPAPRPERNVMARGGPGGPAAGDPHGRSMPLDAPGIRGLDRGTVTMGPGGTWWKDADVVKGIDLTADQVKRIDDIFMKSRIKLIHMHASLEEEQLMLEPLMNANPPDAAKTGAAIDAVADTRASLEKANAHMLLDIRGVLSATQWTKLQELRGHGGQRPYVLHRGGDRGL